MVSQTTLFSMFMVGCLAQFESPSPAEDTGKLTILETLEKIHPTFVLDDETQALLSQENRSFTLFHPTKRALRSFFRYLKWKGKPITHKFMSESIRFHLLNHTMFSGDFSEGSNIVHTMMNNETFVNLNGAPQVINVLKSGQNVQVIFGAPGWKYSTARVVKADLPCKNGVIHIVDTVFWFPMFTSALLHETGASAMLSAVSSAGINSVMDSASNITIFLPLNEAIDRLLSKGDVQQAQTKEVLLGHMLHGAYYSNKFTGVKSLKMMNGKTVGIQHENGHLSKIGGCKVLLTDILLRNGVLHVVDNIVHSTLDAVDK